jgi:hypothetical protein
MAKLKTFSVKVSPAAHSNLRRMVGELNKENKGARITQNDVIDILLRLANPSDVRKEAVAISNTRTKERLAKKLNATLKGVAPTQRQELLSGLGNQ